jgi:autotransporter-associated beta strand protein
MRVTALLLGELSPEEAAALEKQIAADPELAVLRIRLSRALELLREATGMPEPAETSAPVRLSPARRARLLAHFSTPAPQVQTAPVNVPRERRSWVSSWVLPASIAAGIVVMVGFFVPTASTTRHRQVGFFNAKDPASTPAMRKMVASSPGLQPPTPPPGLSFGSGSLGLADTGSSRKAPAIANGTSSATSLAFSSTAGGATSNIILPPMDAGTLGAVPPGVIPEAEKRAFFAGNGTVDSFVSGSSNLGATVFSTSGNNVTVNGGGTLDLNGVNTFAGTRTAPGSAGNASFPGAIGGGVVTGSGALTKSGGGSWNLNGSNAFAGVLNEPALTGANTYGGETTIAGGTLSGASGTNTLAGTLSGANTYTGATSINAGALGINPAPVGPVRLDLGFPVTGDKFSAKSPTFDSNVGYQFGGEADNAGRMTAANGTITFGGTSDFQTNFKETTPQAGAGGLALAQLLQNEFQRTPGQPGTTSLTPTFDGTIGGYGLVPGAVVTGHQVAQGASTISGTIVNGAPATVASANAGNGNIILNGGTVALPESKTPVLGDAMPGFTVGEGKLASGMTKTGAGTLYLGTADPNYQDKVSRGANGGSPGSGSPAGDGQSNVGSVLNGSSSTSTTEELVRKQTAEQGGAASLARARGSAGSGRSNTETLLKDSSSGSNSQDLAFIDASQMVNSAPGGLRYAPSVTPVAHSADRDKDGFANDGAWRDAAAKKASPSSSATAAKGRGTEDLAARTGSQSEMERLNAVDNARTKDKVVRQEVAIQPGDVLNMPAVEASKQRLMNAKYFSKVESNPPEGSQTLTGNSAAAPAGAKASGQAPPSTETLTSEPKTERLYASTDEPLYGAHDAKRSAVKAPDSNSQPQAAQAAEAAKAAKSAAGEGLWDGKIPAQPTLPFVPVPTIPGGGPLLPGELPMRTVSEGKPAKPIAPPKGAKEAVGHRSSGGRVSPAGSPALDAKADEMADVYGDAVENKRRGDYLERGVAAMEAGQAALKDRDYEKATAYFKNAIDLLPDTPATREQHKKAVAQFSEVSTKLANELITEGRYQQAQDTLTEVLDERYDPRNKKAAVMLSHLEQPDYFNKTITPKFRGNVEQVKQWFVEAQGFFDTGRLDLAKQRCEHILEVDPYNPAAREFAEKIEHERDNYGVAAYNHTRAKQVADATNAWAMPVRKFKTEVEAGNRDGSVNEDDIAKQRRKVAELAARAAKIRERNGILDPDPHTPETKLGFNEGAKSVPQQQRMAQEAKVKHLEEQLAALQKLHPEELQDSLHSLGIDDFVVTSLTRYQDLLAERAKLTNEHAAVDDPRVKALERQMANEMKTLKDELATLKRTQETQAELERAKLARLQKAEEREAKGGSQASSAIGDYTVAKTEYLGAEAELRKMETAYVVPTDQASVKAKTELAKKEAFVKSATKEVEGAKNQTAKQDLAKKEAARQAAAKAEAAKKAEAEKKAAAARADEAAKPAPPSPLIPQPEVLASENPFSTFSLNVSDVAFKLAAASLEQGRMPDVTSVRSEEFINAFDYRDPEPAPGAPLAFVSERARYPFAQNRDLLRFSVKTAAAGRLPGRPLNIVLLLDKSGSMERADRVQIVREALRVLAAQLQPTDKLSIVTFARTPHLWADGVPGNQVADKIAQVSEITPEGGTNLEAALDLAYETARRHFAVTNVNRVVLLTDGAANLGDVDPDALTKKVEAKRKQGIALDCFGIGWEDYNDDLLEQLTRNGDGRYGFINTPEEAATNFAGQLAGAFQVAASDVKVQVEFNSQRVTAYRQIGYAKHQLTKEQFRDNTVAAAQIGAAESGNALYVVAVNPNGEGDLATVRVRYRVPGTDDFREHAWVVSSAGKVSPLEEASPALRLAATASAFSEMLAGNPYAAEVTSDRLLALLEGVPAIYGSDPRPHQLETMIRQARAVSGR